MAAWADILEAKFERAPSGCWVWTASRRPHGYGQVWRPATPTDPRRLLSAHRAVYELMVGPIPDGLDLDHLCRYRRCVNPMHLEPVTRRVNILRGICNAAQLARKTHCDSGHPLVRLTTGRRGCPTCRPALRAA